MYKLVISILLFIIFLGISVYSDESIDSIKSTPYYAINKLGVDTTIEKVIQYKDPHTKKKYTTVYYKISQFRKPSTFWVKDFK